MGGPGFDPAGLDMADLGDPRRQEGLPGGYATQGQAVSAPYAEANIKAAEKTCLLYTSPSPRDRTRSRMPSSA